MEIEKFSTELDVNNFNFAQQKCLLTYKTHLHKFEFIDNFKKLVEKQLKGEPKFIRLAHESGDEQINYNHTHVLVDFGKRFQTKNCRFFDYSIILNGVLEVIHPNIRKITSKSHWDNCVQYLAKEDEDNRDLIVKKPCTQVLSIWEKSSLQEAVASVKLRDVPAAIAAYNVKPDTFIKEPKWHTPMEWQQRIIDDISKPPNNRSIIWIFDNDGLAGKSSFIDYVEYYFPDKSRTITQLGDSYHGATLIKNEIEGWTGDTIFIDLARSQNSDKIYPVLEDIKNGRISTLKYQGKTIRFHTCHVVVFANFLPKLEAMSMDRWDIRHVKKPDKYPDTGSVKPLPPKMIPLESPKGSPRLTIDEIKPKITIEIDNDNVVVIDDLDYIDMALAILHDDNYKILDTLVVP